MDLLSISKCPPRAFNRSKYCRKSSKNIWIYMSLTTILNIIKISLKYISFFTSFTKRKKSGSKMDLLSISKCPARAFNRSNTEENQYGMFGFI
jgi:ATP-dependent Zn protease